MRRATTHRACQAWLDNQFQSTLSMRRATGNTAGNVRLIKFQSTLSMRRATRLKQFRSLTAAQFQSTLSMRRATGHVAVVGDLDRISIHALHEESDPILKPNTIRTDISIQLSMRRATRAAHVRHGGTINFNPRSP